MKHKTKRPKRKTPPNATILITPRGMSVNHEEIEVDATDLRVLMYLIGQWLDFKIKRIK